MSQIVLDMACMLLPEPTNESNCSGYGLHALTWANQWVKLFEIWLACSYLSQPMSRNVLDMATVILPETTNESNGSEYGLRDITWANQWAKWLGPLVDYDTWLPVPPAHFFSPSDQNLGIKVSFRKSDSIFLYRKQGSFLTCSTGTTHLAMYALNYTKNRSLIPPNLWLSESTYTKENTYFWAIRYMYG